MNNKFLIEEYADELSAQLFKVKLESNGINTYIEGKSVSDLFSGAAPTHNPVKLYVDIKDIDKSKVLLKQYINENTENDNFKDGHQCPSCGSFEIRSDPWRKWTILITILTLGTLFCTLFWSRKFKCKECGKRWD